MGFREEVLKEYYEVNHQDNTVLEKEKNKQLALQVLQIAKQKLKEGASQKKLACFMDFTKTREIGVNDWKNVQGAEKELPTIAILEGIDFIYYPSTKEHSGPRFIFSIIEYSDDYMINLIEHAKNALAVQDIRNYYFQKESEFIKICRNMDQLQQIPFKIPPKDSKEYILLDDAMSNAFYRLGYDNVKPTYTKYLGDDLFRNYHYIFAQQVRNCVEISHHLQKQKRLDANKTTKRNINR